MTIFKKLFEKLAVFFPWFKTSAVIKNVFVEEFPSDYKKNILYLVGEGDPWYAVMLCPCGCDEVIRLCLQEDVTPSWRLKFNSNDLVSLSPSIWRTCGCKSHFFLTRGKVEWCKN